ncbi:class II fructose-bisphosphate aldolase [Candidatus Daviesbacteria bacterium]|nr:class II fructose-bisphosphate aldolase [Candidatus Daviesbacteria bacterium]
MSVNDWLKKAKEEKFAIGAFNVGNLETFKAVARAAANKKSPVIIESSPGETNFLGADNIVDLAQNFSQDLGVPILVNLDHAQTLEECIKGIEAGYDLIHFDGSTLPLEQNMEIAKKVVELAHQKSLAVEGEMDHITGSSEVHQGSAESEVDLAKFTDPIKAQQFVQNCGLDILAVFFGNVHGVFSQGGENLHLSILEKLAQVLPNTFFSLHGGSGIEDNQVKEAIKRGIVKVNINTQIRQAFRENLEKDLSKNSGEYAMYKIEGPVIEAVQKIVEQKIEVFGSAGKI